ncbi:MAG: radical SAM family heme chaperone HemW [Pseudomonadota bacterium]
MSLARSDDLAVYIHWPFCVSKCPYCDFNSHVRDSIDQDAWRNAYLSEIQTLAARLPGRRVTSVFFGGGTPSLMPADTVAAIVDAVATYWDIMPGAEITLEANPSTVEQGRFQAFRAAGINRVSLGVQALDDNVLKFLERPHGAAEAKQAVALAAQIFPRFSFDLIYARPDQTPAQWRTELREALALAGDHLSLYQLTIEQGTPFYTRHARGEFVMPDADLAARFYEETQDVMTGHGLPAYEISNHARPGQESRHNLTYWRYQDYAGIGPGAHGRITENGQISATRMHRAPDIWLQRVGTQGHGLADDTPVTPQQAQDERIMMGLRLREGLPMSHVAHLDQNRIDQLITEGLAQIQDTRLQVTGRGALVLNEVNRFLLA